jgi:ABC-type Fe3+/spermidine/putrescine transport system ATPase subunit
MAATVDQPSEKREDAVADAAILELRDVSKRFGAVTAVDRVSFAVKAGEVFTLLGPSGCGKTTTLRLVAGLEDPDSGQILLTGRTIAAPREGLFLPPERRNMGMVFQSYAIWPHLTVFENVAFPLRLRRWSRQRVSERVAETLDIVGLSGLQDRQATMLSGGQQQRVALARALAYSPDILLLDEPLSNLDAKLREHMRTELHSIPRRLGIAVLFVTHDQSEAMTLSDRIAVMNAGRFEQIGTPDEVYERPATPFVRDFLGRALILEGVVRRSGELVWVELDGEGGRSIALANGRIDGYEDGTRLIVSCRPEDFRIEPLGPTTANRLPAIVEEASYLGERVEYSVRTAGGRGLTVFNARRERFAVGVEVDLVLDTADATVWPKTEAAIHSKATDPPGTDSSWLRSSE